jgi:hypothetical protein
MMESRLPAMSYPPDLIAPSLTLNVRELCTHSSKLHVIYIWRSRGRVTYYGALLASTCCHMTIHCVFQSVPVLPRLPLFGLSHDHHCKSLRRRRAQG